MDPFILGKIAEVMPKHNRAIADGFAVSQLQGAEDYIEHVWRCAAKSFPEGLEFVNGRRVSPEEHLSVITGVHGYGREGTLEKRRSGRQRVEMARTDVYLMAYQLKWQGKLLDKVYLYLPFLLEAGLMHIRGPLHCVSPVLADVAFSATKESLYIPFTRDKLTFRRKNYAMYINDRVRSTYIAWSAIHSEAVKTSKKAGAVSTIPHYLFAKFGVRDTFKRFANVEPVIGHEEITSNSHPADEWFVFKTIGSNPPSVGRSNRVYQRSSSYTPTTVRFAVRKEECTPLVEALIAGFYYVCDYFNYRMSLDYIDEPMFWRTLLGKVIYRNEPNEGKLIIAMDSHIASLDEYVDDLVIEMLTTVNIHVTNTYDFFVHVIENMNEYCLRADPANGYGKRLKVLNYVLMDIVMGIFRFTFALRNPKKKELEEKTIRYHIGKFLNRELIFNLSSKHGEVEIMHCPNDSKVLKFTTNVVLQADATAARKGKKSKSRISLNDPSKIMHTSVLEFGSFLNLPKHDPNGRNKLNPKALTDQHGRLIRRDEYVPRLDYIQNVLKS